MSYLINKSRGANITINGIDYTRNLTQISIADDSVRGSGIIATSGTVILSQPFGETSIEDYAKTKFLRGHLVIIDVVNSDGSITRHPRGHLYIVESSYDPEKNELTAEIGCKLYLASLTDNINNLTQYTGYTLPEGQRDYSTLSSAIEAEARILYQDNYGNLQKINFFGGDLLGAAVEQGEWTSVFGVTTLGVGPLGGTSVVPDRIELTYQVPSDEAGEGLSRIDTVETTSNYYLVYPATIWERNRPEGGLSGVGGSGTTSELPTDPTSGNLIGRVSDECGSSPISPTTGPSLPTYEPPQGNLITSPSGSSVTETCSEGYTTVPYKATSAVTSIELSTTWYDAPGGQISVRKTEKWGPAVELNSQYYADLYAFCVWSFSSACTPNGGCPLTGLTNVYHGYSQTTYSYGPGGEVLRVVTDTYENTLKGAQSSDWRSGLSSVNGVLEFSSFRELSTNDVYLAKRTITDYEYYENRTIETQTTYTAPTEGENGVGITSGSCFDATCGIITTQRSINTTTNGPDSPNSIPGSGNVNTVTFVIDDVRSPVNYTSPPAETNPVVQQIQLQLPITASLGNPSSLASNFLRYQRKLVEGDSAGLRVVEALRDDIVTNWRPGMPFRYCDPRVNKILALRMNATSWAMDADECVVSTDGIFIGESNGSLVLPYNLTGNETRPRLTQNPIATIVGELLDDQLTVTSVESGSIQVGSILTATGIPEGVYVTGFLSGNGGTGTYTTNGEEGLSFSGEISIFSTAPQESAVPTVEDETGLIGGSFSEVVKVNLYLSCLFSTGGGDNGYGIINNLGSEYFNGWQTWVCYVNGGLYAPGSLMATSPTGGVPLSNGNVLMTSSAVAVDPDLFA